MTNKYLVCRPSQVHLRSISDLRNKASGSPMHADYQNIVNGTMSVIAPADGNSLAFARTPAHVKSIPWF